MHSWRGIFEFIIILIFDRSSDYVDMTISKEITCEKCVTISISYTILLHILIPVATITYLPYSIVSFYQTITNHCISVAFLLHTLL